MVTFWQFPASVSIENCIFVNNYMHGKLPTIFFDAIGFPYQLSTLSATLSFQRSSLTISILDTPLELICNFCFCLHIRSLRFVQVLVPFEEPDTL